MKRYILIPILLLAPCSLSLLQAQDTYMNERLTNSSNDVIGTARYVGMGGALGALGADMSVISWNPAGIGLYRKNDIALTMGGLWGKSSIKEENRGKFTFDQAGFVYNMKTGSETCPYVNFAFNYQKKVNFNHNFYALNDNLGGLSQMDQVAELTYWDSGTENLAGLAIDRDFLNYDFDSEGNKYFYNYYASYNNKYTHHSEGSAQSFDFNISTNVNDRAFLGLTVGVDNMRFRELTCYEEFGDADYALSRNCKITGTGVNVKLGTIIRPFENNPFRFGFVIETPTWYRLRNSTWFDFGHDINENTALRSYLKFNVRTPWKVRTSIGSTVGSTFAWDVDYEYAAYAGMNIGYPELEYADGSTSGNVKDVAMNEFTRDILRGTHTLRIGTEINATKNLAFRLGYNLSTSPYKKNIGFDQYNIDSRAMNYATGTNYMRLGNTNILTLGAGYHAKKFYVDLAYKIRNQKADFYAFDTRFTDEVYGDPVFLDNARTSAPELINATIDPVDVNLTRHTITCTLGFKF